MRKIKHLKKTCFVLFTLISFNGFAQQLTDYFTYYISDTSKKRQNIYYNSDSYNSGSTNKVSYDGENLFFISNIAGDVNFSTYFTDTSIKELPYYDINTSQLYFCKYNLKNHSITAKPFGSNYINKVWHSKIDNQKKSILVYFSTCDDTVRLDPSNQNDFIAFPNRKERNWLVVFDVNGKLISRLLINELNLPSDALKLKGKLTFESFSNFNYDGDIIVQLYSSTTLPNIAPDSALLKKGVSYFINFNSKSGTVKWIRKLDAKNQNIILNEVEGVFMTVCIQLSKKDSIMKFADTDGNTIVQYKLKDENLNDNERISYIFNIDKWGNLTPVFHIISNKLYEIEDNTIVQQMIENNNKIILLILSNNDSIKIFDKYVKGKPNLIYSKGLLLPKKTFFLEVDLNSQYVKSLLQNYNNDSIVPLRIIKSNNGFYLTYPYNNKNVNYNIKYNKDTFNHFIDNDYSIISNSSQAHQFFNIVKYDTNYKIRWMHHAPLINSNIFEAGNNKIIFDIYPYIGGIQSYDINFRPESYGKISPTPIYILSAIYNCKPIAYYRSSYLGNNTYKFTNLSEYNCQYKWVFGDGITTTQNSPTHKFKPSPTSYKIMLVVTNECGSDTFFKYYDITDENTAVPLSFNKNIKIYPNPISGNEFNISITEKPKIKSLKIYNTTGQQLDECSFSQSSSNLFTVSLSRKLPKGIYLLRIITYENIAYISKILID
ncbi:MAG: T9SS type A sorting domain-containing protein [Bacteroidia bacterium]|nr:T9SS type A sorting domain-containing protein [Bacteroidia bacterium]